MPPKPVAAVEDPQEQLQLLAPEDDRAEPTAAPEVEAASKEPVAEASKPGGTTPPKPAAEELASAREAVAQAQAQQAQYQAQAQYVQQQQRQLADAEELRTYRAGLEAEGYDTAQIQSGLQGLQRVQQQRHGLAQQQQQLRQQATIMQQGAEAKVQLATDLSVKYGVPIQNLMKFDSPEEMEIAGLKAQVSNLEQKKGPPQEFNAESAEPSASGSRGTRLAALSEKNTRWSESEYQEAARLRSG